MAVCDVTQSLAVHVGLGRGEGRGNSDRWQLCLDMTETTLDVLARYTYSNVSSQASRCVHVTGSARGWVCVYVCVCVHHRSSEAEFLVVGGPSKTWALRNYLITVTTTGEAGGRPGRCAQCLSELQSTLSHTPRGATARVDDPSTGLCSCWGWGWRGVTKPPT